MDSTSQKARILAYCREFGSITVRDAFTQLNINSPTKRISELKQAGYDVQTIDEYREKENGETVKFRRYFIGGVPNG